MYFLTQQTLSLRLISSAIFLAFLASIIFGYVLLPAKQAQAQAGLATLGQQIRQFILDKIWQTIDLAIQKMTSYFTGITAAIQTWTKLDILLQRALKFAWNTMRKTLLDQLANSVINWSRTGENGQNSFVSDWRTFLAQKTDAAAQEFLTNDLGTAPMNEYYAEDVKQDIRSIDEFMERKSFSQKVNNQNQEEMNKFYNGEFTWDRFEKALDSNYYLDFFTALDDLAMVKDSTYDAEKNKLLANQGNQGDAGTPGIIKSYAAQRVSMMDLDYLLQADDINEYLSALIDAVINRISKEGLDKMKTDDYVQQGQPPKIELPPQALDFVYIETRYIFVEKLTEVMALIQENLQKIPAEQEINLEIMQDIQAVQTSRGCSVTAPIGPELSALEAEIAEISTKISQAEEAAAANNRLLTTMDVAVLAEKSGNQNEFNAATESFKTAHNSAITAFNALFNANDNDMERFFEHANNYNIELVSQMGGYLEERGYPKRNPRRLEEFFPEDSLYDRLRQEERGSC